eukprot:jgi/Tetstr1/445852/TSEL_033492.t1
MKDSWSGRVKMAHQLRRDLERWVSVPNHNNGRSIYKPVETAYMQVDKPNVVRYAVLTFLLELRGRHVLLHEGNVGVVHILANLTSSCAPLLMTKLRTLWFILDSNDISTRVHYIQTTANILVDCLSREIDYDNWGLNLRHFVNHLENI